MIYDLEPELPNYATEKKKLKDATNLDRSTIVAKWNFIALKLELEKVDINKLVNV